jgi:N-methylhydantoinase A
MSRALRVVTVERGIDPRGFALMPFGGAGPMHAAAVAEELGMSRVLCPRAGGVLSALGLCASERRRDTAKTVLLDLSRTSAEDIAREVDSLRQGLEAGMAGAEQRLTYELRYRGQAFELPVGGSATPAPADLAERFAAAHEERFGFRDPGADVELVNVRLAVVEAAADPRPVAAGGEGPAEDERTAWFAGRRVPARVIRGEPPAGFEAAGPVIFELPETTLVLPAAWRARVDPAGTIVAERDAA